jgi:predicted carbohydrate-binding protein with CBM5 and CBM33 domain
MEDPPSRMSYCGQQTTPDQVDNKTALYPECADAFAINPIAAYNFMAVVTHTLGLAEISPKPKNVCGFDGESWSGAETPWDVPMRWPTTQANAGPLPITWNVTWGPHFDDTRDFSYWITKPDFVFSTEKALTWDDFESEPFCMEMYVDAKPNDNPKVVPNKQKSTFITTCTLPERKGHHVIYGEWGRIAPTFERFHGCIDLAFGMVSIAPRQSRDPKLPQITPAEILGKRPLASPTWRNLRHFVAPEKP